MSGLEIAGVVLGSLPLIISALEHYAEGMNKVRRYWLYKAEFKSLILQINTERIIFTNTLELVLTGIVRIEHMAGFISQPSGNNWKTVGKLLKHRLGGAYDVYIENVRGMEASLRQIMKKLALAPDGTPQFTDTSLFKHEYKRLKFSLSKSEYSENLRSLRNHNQALVRLTQQSLDLEPSRSKHGANLSPDFGAIQSYMRGLYGTLLSGLHCPANDCDGHGVKLRLDNGISKEETEEPVMERARFRVILSSAAERSKDQDYYISTAWKELEICCLPEISVNDYAKALSRESSQMPSTTMRQRAERAYKARSVGTDSITLIPRPVAPVPRIMPQQIGSLCKAVKNLHESRSRSCIGYLVDSKSRKQGIYSLEVRHDRTQETQISYSLRHLLTNGGHSAKRLSQLDKLQVAAKLCANTLQLYNTPWSNNSWVSSEVFFVHRLGDLPTFAYQEPFVYRGLSPQTSMTTPSQGTLSRVIRNQTLFTLGILLIELWYGMSIEGLQSPADLSCQGTPGVTWCTAIRIAEDEIEFQAGKRYADAVRRCIRCDFFDQTVTDLENEGFQQAVFEGVVVPIKKTLEQFKGII